MFQIVQNPELLRRRRTPQNAGPLTPQWAVACFGGLAVERVLYPVTGGLPLGATDPSLIGIEHPGIVEQRYCAPRTEIPRR